MVKFYASCMAISKNTLNKMSPIVKNRNISLDVKMKLFKSFV